MKNLLSAGDIAHRLGVHVDLVLAWARDSRIQKLGREYVFRVADLRRFERALDAVADGEDGDEDAELEGDDREDEGGGAGDDLDQGAGDDEEEGEPEEDEEDEEEDEEEDDD